MMDAEDWKEKIIEDMMGSFEEGDTIFSDDDIESMVVDFINAKFENDEMDVDIRDELIENVQDIVEELRQEYQIMDGDSDSDE
jgi:hypothetical protein